MPYVKDTVVVATKALPGADNTTWKELVIAWENAAFKPGQFLMAAPVAKAAITWPAPVMIQRAVPEGFVVYVHPDSPLYSLRRGDALTAWGPNGKGAPVEGRFAVLCDAKGLLLVAPLLQAYKQQCQGVYLVGGIQCTKIPPVAGGLEVKPVESLENAGDFDGAQSLVVALPLEKLAQWQAAVTRQVPQALVYVGAKVGCGMGACRGCYIHSKQASTGVAVCQEGPFLPMDAVDYEKDQNSLGHYV